LRASRRDPLDQIIAGQPALGHVAQRTGGIWLSVI
jgi:hypothetical protein